ncbi:MAG: dTDP-4-dehydrorhamnose reductase [Desulfobacterales bacterium]|nr:dTDP-4-dehydrorhamnose reductase [Desulfobacterales bacterium]
MRIVVTGAQGQLGSEVVSSSVDRGFDAVGLPRSRLDITRSGMVAQAIEDNRPDLVINCAAFTAVDLAETEMASALAANRDGPANLAAACSRLSIPLVHISTDYVFDGTQADPYAETDPVRPINAYGASKLAGEQAIQARIKHFIILRTAWVFGIHGHNFVKTMLKLAMERENLRVVDDQIGCPTYAGHLAETIATIVAHYRRQGDIPWGIYHYGGQPPISWHGLAEHTLAVAREMGLPQKVDRLEAIPTSDYPLPAKRAANSRLDCRKIRQAFGVEPSSWRRGVQAVVADWCRTHAPPAAI